jgi:hypothetical protein
MQWTLACTISQQQTTMAARIFRVVFDKYTVKNDFSHFVGGNHTIRRAHLVQRMGQEQHELLGSTSNPLPQLSEFPVIYPYLKTALRDKHYALRITQYAPRTSAKPPRGTHHATRFSLRRTKNLLISAVAAGMAINGSRISHSFSVNATVSNASCKNGT